MGKPKVVNLTAVPGRRISVGINYPWAWDKYGEYFGGLQYRDWLSNLDKNLGQLSDIGVSVVRIFLLCNAHTLGTTRSGVGPLVPTVNPVTGDLSFTNLMPWWNFVPPNSVSNIYFDQLDQMLEIFGRHEMSVIPSIVDFPAFATGEGKEWKTDLITDPTMSSWFLENFIGPLLDRAAKNPAKDNVLAWEVMNEPGQITTSAHALFLKRTEYFIPRNVMVSFLNSVCGRIEGKGFKSTVGHHYAGDLDLPTGKIPQFHYYPQQVAGMYMPFVPYHLPPQSETQAFVGEFGSSFRQFDQPNTIAWPDVPASYQSGLGLSRIVTRLQHIEAKGYGLALLWPDIDVVWGPQPAAPPDPPHYSQPVLNGIKSYLG